MAQEAQTDTEPSSARSPRGIRLAPRPRPDEGPPELPPPVASPAHAVVLAGGRGLRLRPHTLTGPKPMVTVGEYPILEIILRQLRWSGVTRVTLCVGYMAEVIQDALEDGSRLGLSLEYYVDPEPLGTAGPLAALPEWSEPVVVMNADILTALHFGRLYASHQFSGAALTVAAHVTETLISQGVLDIVGRSVRGLWEKPRMEVEVCAGIYVLSPHVRESIPRGGRFDMTDLMELLIARGERVEAHRFTDAWHDMGTHEGLAQARQSFTRDRALYLSPSAESAYAGERNGPVHD
ncbi:sugar phosphate nucleotidyltransferase [Streptomyces sp. BK205]|uniref:sugar phosphate nucleotidyltransferase n=1 Tax=Streptomyces sp. BK205 TaxID=2512164 RepID=UPI0010495B26|nr:sugar phosphate nucleotidyltransferase [Streptomyces sp. BK205]